MIERIEKAATAYSEALNNIEKNRATWQNYTKPLLIETLSKITKMFKLDWSVYPLIWAINSEAVNIQMHSRPSGIFEKTEKGSKSYVKNGGVINFSQAYNGQIFVRIIYPSVDELVGTMENNVLGRYNPEEITEEFILSKVEYFIEEMTRWEKCFIFEQKDRILTPLLIFQLTQRKNQHQLNPQTASTPRPPASIFWIGRLVRSRKTINKTLWF